MNYIAKDYFLDNLKIYSKASFLESDVPITESDVKYFSVEFAIE